MPIPVQFSSLKNQEAAVLLGEQTAPNWKSPNELIHERVNFDDTIWGFGLAGGSYYNYKTPLRVTYVKRGSRAEKAHIYPGDILLKINGVETVNLTLEEAHQMIVESGIHIMLNVTAPEDVEDSYYCYQDPIIEEVKEEEVEKEFVEEPKKEQKPFKKSSRWGLQWPWKCKRKIIWKESNCYLVPSKFEEKHPGVRKPEVKQEDIVLDSIYKERKNEEETEEEATKNDGNENTEHGNEETEFNGLVDKKITNATEEEETNNDGNENTEHGNEETESNSLMDKNKANATEKEARNNDGNENTEHGNEEMESNGLVDKNKINATEKEGTNNDGNENTEHGNEETELEKETNNDGNENKEHGNEETESNGLVDKNNDAAGNDETNGSDAYFDKTDSGISGMSESEKFVTNGR